MKNELKFTGVIAEIRPIELISGRNGKDYQKQLIVVEETDEKYPNSIVFENFFEDGKENKLEGVFEGETVTVHYSTKATGFDTKATESKPSVRMVNSKNAIWKIERSGVTTVSAPATNIPPQIAPNETGSDLPF